MAKIDRLGWAAGFAFYNRGARIGIRVSDPCLLDRLKGILPPGSSLTDDPVVGTLYSFNLGGPSKTASVRRYHLVYRDEARIMRSMELDDALEVLESDLHTEVAEYATDGLFVHAGVVGWHGRAIVIPGRSHSGKTSLVQALIRAGAEYYSDEYAVIDRRGRVHPYPKALSIRPPDGGRATKVLAEQLQARVGSKPLRTGLIALARYAPMARWRPRVLSEAEALVGLLDNTIRARIDPDRALATLSVAVRGAIALKGRRSDADPVAKALMGLV